MDKFVLLVEFQIGPDNYARFHELIAENARLSVELEPGCSQFDVCRSKDDPARILLYEVYTDDDAFNARRSRFFHCLYVVQLRDAAGTGTGACFPGAGGNRSGCH